MSSILRITNPIPSDTSIDSYEDIEYKPVAGTNLNNYGEILSYTSKLKIFLRIPAKAI